MDTRKAPGTQNALDGLRGVAILFVLICHFSLENDFLKQQGLSDPLFSGVELFFLISGYGITASVLSRPYRWREYLKKRARRIYPSLIALLLMCFFMNFALQYRELSDFAKDLYLRTSDQQLADSLRILTGTYIWSNNGEYTFGAIWYLSVQMQFYVVVGVLSQIAKSGQGRRRLFFSASGVIVLACLIARIAVLLGGTLTNPILVYLIGWKADVPFWGVLLYGIAESLQKRQLPAIRWSRPISFLLLVIPVFVLMRTGSAVSTIDGNRLLTGLGYPVCILCYGLLILLCVTEQKTFLSQNSRILSYLSSRSYPLFLFNFVGLLFGWLLINHFLSWTFYTGSYVHYGIAQMLIGGFFVLVLAELDYQLVENRLISRKPEIPISTK